MGRGLWFKKKYSEIWSMHFRKGRRENGTKDVRSPRSTEYSVESGHHKNTGEG